jgi:formylglycine-generating enzyme required for sulfatase activity
MDQKSRTYRRSSLIWASIAIIVIGMACALTQTVGDISNPEKLTGAPKPGKPPARANIGDTWTSKADGMTLVYVPAGTFLMGAREFDEFANQDEMPMREVDLNGFWIDQTEVTNAMYAKFLTTEGNGQDVGMAWYEFNSPDAVISVFGPDWVVEDGYEDHPVYEVTWYGAQAYCEWVGRRLPTEAEWEKAARGTTGQIYPWGNDAPNCGLVNFWDGNQVCSGDLAPVGGYVAGASPYGALDMAGNLWEWTADWYSEHYYKNGPSENPEGPANGSYKVFRGGAWESGPRNVRASDRNSDEPNAARYRLGFRCALTP